jgi:hypothetical protein
MPQVKLDYYDHPVFSPQELHFETNAMDHLCNELHRWLWNGITGGLVYGHARDGKTKAVLAMIDRLFTRGAVQVPVYYVSTPPRDRRVILTIFRQLCWKHDLRVKDRDPADILAERFVNFIADNAKKTACQNAVLIVDEMQRLHVGQFDAFSEIYDKLQLLKINLMVVFVGNDPACWRIINHIERPGYAHIRGRFFIQGIAFNGLLNKQDVTRCLDQYDTLRFPDHGSTYTNFFLPEHVEQGWKLATLSGDVWRIFREYQKHYKLTSWGMQYFISTINTLLTDFLPRYGVDSIDDDMIHEAIRISGLVPSLVRPLK